MGRYAAKTEVSSSKSRDEIERTLTRYGADQFAYGWRDGAAIKQRWRALALIIKAKLEAVESGISEFDDEFLANIMLPDGATVGEWFRPQLAEAYRIGSMPTGLPMLEDHSGSE